MNHTACTHTGLFSPDSLISTCAPRRRDYSSVNSRASQRRSAAARASMSTQNSPTRAVKLASYMARSHDSSCAELSPANEAFCSSPTGGNIPGVVRSTRRGTRSLEHSYGSDPSVTRPVVYLSGTTARGGEIRTHAEELQTDGFEVASRWLWSVGNLPAHAAAERDLEDLRRSEVMLAFTQGVGNQHYGRGGRHVEFGVALALGLTTIVVGPLEHVFHEFAGVQAARDWRSARELLDEAGFAGGPSGRTP